MPAAAEAARDGRLTPSRRAGVVAAAATVPLSLVPLLRPRSWLDQGVVTGTSSALGYAMTATVHDVVLGTADRLLTALGRGDGVVRTGRATLAVDVVGLLVGAGVHLALPRREDEPALRAVARTGARMIASACASGAVPGAIDALAGRLDPERLPARALRTVPASALVGAAVGVGAQRWRDRRARAAGLDLHRERRAPVRPSYDAGALLLLGAVAPLAVERALSQVAIARLERVGLARTGARPFRHRTAVLGHASATLVIAAGLYGFGAVVYRRAEQRLGTPDPDLAEPPSSPWVSGSPGSAVEWSRLSREPRRHLVRVRPAARIAEVMGEPAREPIRLYVGLDSARTVEERVALAMAELDRTAALDRSLLVLCSPTGSGFVNHVACAAWELLSRGDCATLTLQYANRPSPMALDRVDEAREQNRAAWSAVAEAVRGRPPDRRPRVALFGESLGAHTSQDAFLHTGTAGLARAMIDRALWLGTPAASAWSRRADALAVGEVSEDGIVRLTGAQEIDRLHPRAAARARYVLLAHDDDAIPLFSPELLIREPSWLAGPRRPGVPGQAAWSTPVTFLQCAVDVKNANNAVVGGFDAAGHDYRADLARAVRFAFGLPCTEAQLAAVERALRVEAAELVALWG
ncbi:alpha/beta-hydrolase family protein [Actinotalea sp.]|uniref:alpha/beta-hydrolase family protein n=1 Tax=Actinotalea sp. TaxID=1872145 RepID=UPI0035671B8B